MDIEQLRYFQCMARTEHMTNAAEELCISQSALSRSINRIEFQLGTPLFDREGRSLKLNRYGKHFLYRVNRILKEYEDALKEMKSITHPETGEVSLGFLHSLGAEMVPKLISSFHQLYPKVKFKIHQDSSSALLQQLDEGILDVCLVTPMPNFPQIEFSKIWKDRLFLALPPSHPLAKFETIELEQLFDQPFIFQKKGLGLRNRMDALCKEANFTPHIAFEGEEISTVLGLVSAGLGITFVPAVSEMKNLPLKFIPLTSTNAFRLVGVAHKKGHFLSPTIIQFQKYTHYYIEKYPERFSITT